MMALNAITTIIATTVLFTLPQPGVIVDRKRGENQK